MAITGNFAAYLHFLPTDANAIWRSDFEKVTLAASTFYTACIIVPLAMWIHLKRTGIAFPLVDLTCIYGYSQMVYIPMAMLSVPKLSMLRWLAIFAAFLVSSQNMVFAVWRGSAKEREDPIMRSKIVLGLLIFLAVQAGIALIVKLYFFHY